MARGGSSSRKIAFAGSVLLAFAASAVTVDSVLVRQDWPWSPLLKVEYRVSDTADRPFDVTASVFCGGTQVSDAVVRSALVSGELDRLDGREALHAFTLDPRTLFGGKAGTAPDVRVTLSAAPTPEPALYKVFDLEAPPSDKNPLDITRSDLLNGKYGAVETDFSRIHDGFSTTLDDVLIWTDAVNYPGAKTTKLVMRRIPAADKTFTFGSAEGEYGHQDNETTVEVKLTEDFYIGVFELTQRQFELIWNGGKDLWGYALQPFANPGDAVAYHNQRNMMARGAHDMKDSTGKPVDWPNNAEHPHACYGESICGKLRQKFGGLEFDLPTEAQWEFACRAGSATSLPSGREVGNGADRDSRINQYAQECGWIYWYNSKEAQRYVHEVGLKAPNAYGLYDMIGNVSEQCLDYMSAQTVSWANDGPVTDPVGPTSDLSSHSANINNLRVFRGPNFGTWYSHSRIAYRRYNYGGEGQPQVDQGLRLVIPASATGKWASSPGGGGSAVEAPEPGLLFHASFDKFTTTADFAVGSRQPIQESPVDLQLRMNPDVKGGTAMEGNSVSLTNPEMLTYPMAGNMRPNRGTVSFWTKMVNHSLANGKYYPVFFQAEMRGFTMLVYKYGPEPDKLLFWMNVGGSLVGGGQVYQRTVSARWREGEWHKVDVTWDNLSMGLYVDGVAAHVQPFDPPENIPSEVSAGGYFSLNRAQGWQSGDGNTTDYDELKIYDRKLSAAEIYDAFARTRPDLAAGGDGPVEEEDGPPRLVYECHPERQALAVRLDTSVLPGGGEVEARLELVEKATEKVVVAADAVFEDPETPVDFVFGDRLEENTEYELVARPSGSELVSRVRFLMPDLSFVRKGIARDHTVPKPWTAVTDEGDGVFGVLDRRYAFREGIFPTQVTGKGTELLARPPTLEIGGADVRWDVPELVENAGDYVLLSAKGRAAGLELDGTAKLWFDGFVETRFAVRPAAGRDSAALGPMKLKWTVAPVASRYLLAPYFKPWDGDRFEGRWGFDMPDLQAVWLTGIDRGFVWWNESPANWLRTGGNDIHIDRENGEAAVTVDMVARSGELKGEAVYTMGWQGTPPREIGTGYRTFLHCRNWKTNGDWSVVGWSAQSGVSAPDNMLYFSTSFIPERPQDFGPYLDDWLERGKTCLSYGMPTHLCDMEEPWDYFYTSCRKLPGNVMNFKDVVTGRLMHVDPCCPHTAIGDYQLGNIEKLFTDYPQLGGLYFDISHVESCKNELHGHGGTDAFGQKYATSCALSMRDYFLRVRKLCERHGRILHLHAHNRYYPFVHSFADACWPGEERYP